MSTKRPSMPRAAAGRLVSAASGTVTTALSMTKAVAGFAKALTGLILTADRRPAARPATRTARSQPAARKTTARTTRTTRAKTAGGAKSAGSTRAAGSAGKSATRRTTNTRSGSTATG